MSEGGVYPWRRQSITGNPGDYSCLSNPLPNPPKGQAWVRNPETREWSIIDMMATEQEQRNVLEDLASRKQQLLVPENCDYLEHHVEPTDTLQGICLQYGVKPLTLRQANKFSGSNLLLAPETLIIPLLRQNNVKTIAGDEDKNSSKDGKEVKIKQLILAFRTHKASTMLSRKEAIAYLDMNDGNLEMAIKDAKDDFGWEIGEGEESSLL
jgi:hypothetical protein|eukprot:165065_1